MIELLRLIVEFTPTEKDDQLLDSFEHFIAQNPELASMFLRFILGLARAKKD